MVAMTEGTNHWVRLGYDVTSEGPRMDSVS